MLWNGKPTCPYCKRKNSTRHRTEARHHCNICNAAFSVTVGTVFHGTRVPLQKWFLSIALMMGETKDPSARSLASLVQVNKNTANSLVKRIRSARAREFNLFCQITEDIGETND